MARVKRRSGPVDQGVRERLVAHYRGRLARAPYRRDYEFLIERLEAGEPLLVPYFTLRAVGVDVQRVDGHSHVVGPDGSVSLSENMPA